MSKQVTVKQAPNGQRDRFPNCLIGPPYKVEVADEASERHFTFELEMWWRDGRRSFVIWRLPGRKGQDEDVLDELRRRAAGLGVCCVWIYECYRPLDIETVQYIEKLNKKKPWRK